MKPSNYWITDKNPPQPTLVSFRHLIDVEAAGNKDLPTELRAARRLTLMTYQLRLEEHGVFQELGSELSCSVDEVKRLVSYRITIQMGRCMIELWSPKFLVNDENQWNLVSVELYDQDSMTRPFAPLTLPRGSITLADNQISSANIVPPFFGSADYGVPNAPYVLLGNFFQSGTTSGPGSWDPASSMRHPSELTKQWQRQSNNPQQPFGNPSFFSIPPGQRRFDMGLDPGYGYPEYSNNTRMPGDRWGGPIIQQQYVPANNSMTDVNLRALRFFDSYRIDEVLDVRTTTPSVAALTLLRLAKSVHPDFLDEFNAKIDEIVKSPSNLNPEFIIKAKPVQADPELKGGWDFTHAKLEFMMIIDGAGVRAEATNMTFKVLLK